MIKGILATLPQANVIEEQDAERWLAGVLRWHRDRAPWHARRLKGIGGSEIGAVIRGANGLKGTGFSNLKQVVQAKLMKRLPEFETHHMRRGTVLEPLARLAFLYRYQAQQDLQALKVLESAKSKPGYEWLVGNPDDLITLNGKRFVNDYKVPSSYSDSDEIEFDYDAQLHHYALMARFHSVPIHGLLLTKLDLAPELAASLVERVSSFSDAQLHELARSIAKTNVPGFRVVSHVVEMRRDMQLDILDCGYHCWHDMVLQGVVPDMGKAERVELDDMALLDVGRYQQQYAMAKAGIAYLDSIASSAEEAISARLENVAFEGKAMPLSLVKVNPAGYDKERLVQEALRRGANEDELASDKRTYSVVALIEEIKRLNGNPEAPHLYERGLDAKKAEAYLKECGVDLTQFQKPGVRLRLSTKKQDKEIAGVFERSASEVFGSWITDHAITAEHEDGMEAIDEMDLEVASGTLQEAFADALSTENEDFEPQHPMNKSAALR